MKRSVITPSGIQEIEMTPAEIASLQAEQAEWALMMAKPKAPSQDEITTALIAAADGDKTKLNAVKAKMQAYEDGKR